MQQLLPRSRAFLGVNLGVWPRAVMWTALASLGALALCHSARPAPAPEGDELFSETPAERTSRHERVARRRAGTIVICHRGAGEFGVENTLAAYEAAFLLGADGIEIDLRRTRDGTIVLFHDDMLDRLIDAFGVVPDLYFDELRLLRFQPEIIPLHRSLEVPPGLLVPTFAEVLALVRHYGGLLQLDVKEPGLEPQITQLLEAADAFEHVVWVNEANAKSVKRDPRIHELTWKGGFLENQGDLEPETVREMLRRPGQLVILDDPRLVLKELGRWSPRNNQRQTNTDLRVADGPMVHTDGQNRPPSPPIMGGARQRVPETPPIIGGLGGRACRAAPSTTSDTSESLLAWILGENPAARAPVPGRVSAVELVKRDPVRAARMLVGAWRPDRPATVKADLAWGLGMALREGEGCGLGGRGREAASRALLALLHDTDVGVRYDAAWACGRGRVRGAVSALAALLRERRGDPNDVQHAPERQSERGRWIRLRAAAAEALGQIGAGTPEVVGALAEAVRGRWLHPDFMVSGLDGACAARALGRVLGYRSGRDRAKRPAGAGSLVPRAVEALVAAVRRDDPRLERLNEIWAAAGNRPNPRAWWDWRVKLYAVAALGTLGGEGARDALGALLEMTPEERRPLGPGLGEEAAAALGRVKGAAIDDALLRLLDHPERGVRRRALLTCLDRSTEKRRRGLKRHTPWALELAAPGASSAER